MDGIGNTDAESYQEELNRVNKWLQRVKNYPLGIVLSDLKDFILSAPREMMSKRRRVRTCKPEQRPVGNVLLCYSNVAFFLKADQPLPSDQTGAREGLGRWPGRF